MIVALFSKVMESKSTLGMPRAYPYQVGILSTPFKSTVDIHHVIFARIAQLHKMCEPDHISIHLRIFTYFKYFLIMDTGQAMMKVHPKIQEISVHMNRRVNTMKHTFNRIVIMSIFLSQKIISTFLITMKLILQGMNQKVN